MIAEPTRLRSLAVAWWREIITVSPHTGGPWSAVRVSISVTVPLAAVLVIGKPEWAGYAVFGSLNSVYGKQYGYSDRMRAQLGAGSALTIAVLLGVITGIPGPGSIWAIAAMSVMSMLGFVVARCFGWLPIPSLFLVFATGTISSSQHVWGDVVEALVVAVLAALFGVSVGQSGRLFPASRPKTTAPQPMALRALWDAAGVRALMLQYAIAPFAAGVLATVIGLGHPYWAAVTATVPIIATTLAVQLGRATLRILGTAIGIWVAYVLIAMQAPIWILVLEVAVFQVLTELFVARNYGVAVICITPMALILSHLANPATVADLVIDRLLDTVLGVVVSVLVLVVARYAVRRRRRGQ
jgi:hypothetical protein